MKWCQQDGRVGNLLLISTHSNNNLATLHGQKSAITGALGTSHRPEAILPSQGPSRRYNWRQPWREALQFPSRRRSWNSSVTGLQPLLAVLSMRRLGQSLTAQSGSSPAPPGACPQRSVLKSQSDCGSWRGPVPHSKPCQLQSRSSPAHSGPWRETHPL